MVLLALRCVSIAVGMLTASSSVFAQMTPAQQAQLPDSNPNSQVYNSRYLPSLGVSEESYPWIDRFGSFAMSSSSGWSGWSQNLTSEEAANAAAIDQCKERSGGLDDCKVIVSFQNQCLTVVRSERHTSYGRADNLAQSRAAAMRSCRASGGVCEVLREGCSVPELKR